jgi:2-keto-3-deoxy-L-rhamnonate aldolase RhmA
MSGYAATLPPNEFKTALREGRPQIGLWSSLCSNLVAELLAHTGYDWLVVDSEHAPNDPKDVLAQLQAMTGGSAEPMVRVPWNDPVLIKRILDVGGRTLLVPFVQSAEEARAAVAATRYPPRGIRGVSVAPRANRFGRVPGYLQNAERDICVVVQLETRAALGALEAIAAIDGIDGLFIGPSDLAADLGHHANSAHPEVQSAIAEACRRIRDAGKPAGILAPVEADARRYFDMGFTYVAIGSDVGLLAGASAAVLGRMREAVGR